MNTVLAGVAAGGPGAAQAARRRRAAPAARWPRCSGARWRPSTCSSATSRATPPATACWRSSTACARCRAASRRLLLRGAGHSAGRRRAVPVGHRHGQSRQREHLRDGRRGPAHREHEQGDARQHQRRPPRARLRRNPTADVVGTRDDAGARAQRGQAAHGSARRPRPAGRRDRRLPDPQHQRPERPGSSASTRTCGTTTC